jgi:hypothetical protein
MITLSMLAAILPAPADYLSVGKVAGDEITLTVGPVSSWGYLIGGPLLILAALILIWVMYGRVRFFALEYGDGGFGGRMKIIMPYLMLGGLLCVSGGVLGLIGWNNLGYSVTLGPVGLTEKTHDGLFTYRWVDLKEKSEMIKSTTFWLKFERDEHSCRVQFQQQQLGEKLQDQAISLAESSISAAGVLK